jgi:1,5-anhydro-D-fructose reductase (1,5-anhydro-D-mannitol-forming)
MIGVGLVGVGFMGKMHFGVHQSSGKSRIVALCDIDENKLKGDWSAIGGNINDPSAKNIDLTGIKTYTNLDEMLSDPAVELVDITLPTYLHAENVIRALKAGKHVLCEKPISLTLEEAGDILKAARTAKGKLMVAHCIRWWPEYALVREMIRNETYGPVFSAVFRRISATPTWGWKNWLQDASKSGGACIDLHIHDIDYIDYIFGRPQAVSSFGITKTSGGMDHIITSYHYDVENLLVVAEGNWVGHPGTPFEMMFQITCEKATIQYTSAREKTLAVYPKGGGVEYPKFEPGDGYHNEIHYFLDCIEKNVTPSVVTPAEAREALAVALAEIQSAETGKTVPVAK